jgi:thioredoxin reductase (NADPH)
MMVGLQARNNVLVLMYVTGQLKLIFQDIHKVWINETKELHCETVIISTGASAKYLGLHLSNTI